ncbi:MAG: hypothetical protein ACRDJ4_09110 [Actinomycetota bacterium]
MLLVRCCGAPAQHPIGLIELRAQHLEPADQLGNLPLELAKAVLGAARVGEHLVELLLPLSSLQKKRPVPRADARGPARADLRWQRGGLRRGGGLLRFGNRTWDLERRAGEVALDLLAAAVTT